MASRAPLSVCGVCFEDGSDRRVLPCLHSFCATCIDQLALRSESREFDLECPLCRARVRLPPAGAAGLPKDPTHFELLVEHTCAACKDEGQAGQATAWCKGCKCALCTNHVGVHLLSGLGPSSHPIEAFPHPGGHGSANAAEEAWSVCAEHNFPLDLYCKQCKVVVCGHCTAIGVHKGHDVVLDQGSQWRAHGQGSSCRRPIEDQRSASC